MNTSYLITFTNVFDRKYFDDNMEKFIYLFKNNNNWAFKELLKELIVSHSSTFIEIKGKQTYFSYYDLLEKIPNTKIVKKLVKGKKISYIKIKKESYL